MSILEKLEDRLMDVSEQCDRYKERITELESTNRLLCRDLDEAQRSIEVLRGWEGRAESSAEIQALKDALREVRSLIIPICRNAESIMDEITFEPAPDTGEGK